MAKTYTSSLPAATTGTVLTASNYNNLITDVNNLVVPPMIKAQPNTARTLTTSGGSLLILDVASGTTPSTQIGAGFTTDPTLSNPGASNCAITVNTAGIYLVVASAVVGWTGTLTSFNFFIQQTISSGTLQIANQFVGGVSMTGSAVFNCSGITALSAGDTLQMLWSWGGATSPSFGATDSRNYLSAVFLGRYS